MIVELRVPEEVEICWPTDLMSIFKKYLLRAENMWNKYEVLTLFV
jgi:hypothetical protein